MYEGVTYESGNMQIREEDNARNGAVHVRMWVRAAVVG